MFCPRVLTFVLTLAAIGCGGDDDDSVGDGDADSDSDADSAPRELHRFFDDVAIATTRIGCALASMRPNTWTPPAKALSAPIAVRFPSCSPGGRASLRSRR